MPTHVYVGFRRPPTKFDHLLAHPYELMLAAYGILGGVLALVSAFNHDISVSRSLEQLPVVGLAASALLLILGGGGILHGLFDDSPELGRGFSRERQGLVLAAAGWTVYALCIAWLSPSSVLSWGLCVSLVAAKLLRFVATVRQESGIRRDVQRGLAET